MAAVYEKNQMSFSLHIGSQFKSNFIFSIYVLPVQEAVKSVMFRHSIWLSCPYMMKNIKNNFFVRITGQISVMFCRKNVEHHTIQNAFNHNQSVWIPGRLLVGGVNFGK